MQTLCGLSGTEFVITDSQLAAAFTNTVVIAASVGISLLGPFLYRPLAEFGSGCYSFAPESPTEPAFLASTTSQSLIEENLLSSALADTFVTDSPKSPFRTLPDDRPFAELGSRRYFID
jgi:hypothetical protein